MKDTEKKKPVSTIPQGVWESSRPGSERREQPDSKTTDLQGNGYPLGQYSREGQTRKK